MNKLLFLIAFIPFSILAQGTLTVQNGGTLTIEKEASVTVDAGLIVDADDNSGIGTVILNSDSKKFASLIVTTSTGIITYNRHVNKEGLDEWDLIGAPVTDLLKSKFVVDNRLRIVIIGTNYAIGAYSNLATEENADGSDANTDNDPWIYFQKPAPTTSDKFNSGEGYSMATWPVSGSSVGETMQFTGGVETTSVSVSVTLADTYQYKGWNLVANPYPSYIVGGTGTGTADGGTADFLNANVTSFDTGYQAVYGYNANGNDGESTKRYTAYNLTSDANLNDDANSGNTDAFTIAPGQGFFVKVKNENDISFTPAMRTNTASNDDFIAGRGINTSYELVLEMYNNTDEIGSTKLYFKEGLTLGLDPGYDAGAYRQTTPISTRLVEEDQGINFSINAMSDADINSTTIPLVLNQGAGQVISIGIASNSLSEDVKVYLEDTLNSTRTLLQENNFELTTQSAISEAGRFYIHLTTSVLANEDVLNNSLVNMYKGIGNNFITIEGLRDEASIKLYDILGKQVRTKVLSASNETLSTIGLSSGIYIIQLKSNNQILTKKVQID